MSDEWTVLDMILAYLDIEKDEFDLALKMIGTDMPKRISFAFQWDTRDNVITRFTPLENGFYSIGKFITFKDIRDKINIIREHNEE